MTIGIDFEQGARIRVANVALNAELTLTNGPAHMMIREAFQNAVEAFRHPDETVRQIWFRAKDVPGFPKPKLSIVNTGVGMSAEELLRATDLNGSLKATGIATDQNRGEGMKVSSLHYNPLGVIWRSRKNGVVSEVRLGWSTRNGWVRGVQDTGEGFEEAWEVELTDLEREHHYKTDGDWVEMIFLGRRPEQNTFLDPYDTTIEDSEAIKNDLLARYYAIPHIERVNLPHLILYTSSATATNIGYEGERIVFPNESFENKRSFEVERVPLKGHPGVDVEFVHAKHLGARREFPARCGFVSRCEQYRMRTGKNWRNHSLFFGLVGMGGQVSVLVHYPEEGIRADRYREGLKRVGSPDDVSMDDLRSAVEASRPDWVRKLLATNSAAPTRDIQKDLEAFLATLQAERNAKGDLKAFAGGASGKATGSGTKAKPTKEKTGTTDATAAAKEGGKARIRQIIPTIEWLKDTSDFPDLEHRTVSFAAADDGGTLYFNVNSPMIESYGQLLLGTHLEASAQDHTRDFVLRELRDYAALRVAQFVVFQQYLRGQKGYSVGDVEDALKVIPLNNVVLGLRENLPEWSRALSVTTAYRKVLAGGPPEISAEMNFDKAMDEDLIG